MLTRPACRSVESGGGRRVGCLGEARRSCPLSVEGIAPHALIVTCSPVWLSRGIMPRERTRSAALPTGG